MGEPDMITIYRIYNITENTLYFKTRQAFEVSLTPGAAIDMFSYELEGSESFSEIDDPATIWKITCQKFTCTPDLADQLEKLLNEFRGVGSVQSDYERPENGKAGAEESKSKGRNNNDGEKYSKSIAKSKVDNDKVSSTGKKAPEKKTVAKTVTRKPAHKKTKTKNEK